MASKRPEKAREADRYLQKRGGIYYYVRRVIGRLLRRSLRTTDVRKARAERDRIIREERSLKVKAPPSELLWEHAAGAFIVERLEGPGSPYAPDTARRYACTLRQLGDALQGVPLSEITTATALDYITARLEGEDRVTARTVKNDLTAWSKTMDHAVTRRMVEANPLRLLPRGDYLGRDETAINPPTDEEVAAMVAEVEGWNPTMATLFVWLRETGMRLGEALHLQRGDIHPCGLRATLRHGVKGNRRSGRKTRVIWLGRAADLLPRLGKEGRLFGDLPLNVARVSTAYGQWCRQRQGREDRLAGQEDREPQTLRRFRIHDLRHAFAMASVVDHPNRPGELRDHMGHQKFATTEVYTRHLRGEGYQWRYARRPDLFGSLPEVPAPAAGISGSIAPGAATAREPSMAEA